MKGKIIQVMGPVVDISIIEGELANDDNFEIYIEDKKVLLLAVVTNFDIHRCILISKNLDLKYFVGMIYELKKVHIPDSEETHSFKYEIKENDYKNDFLSYLSIRPFTIFFIRESLIRATNYLSNDYLDKKIVEDYKNFSSISYSNLIYKDFRKLLNEYFLDELNHENKSIFLRFGRTIEKEAKTKKRHASIIHNKKRSFIGHKNKETYY